MERFAFITFPDSGEGIISRHKILNKFPQKIAKVCTCIKGPTRIDVVTDKKSQIELGYIYNIPTIHYRDGHFIFDDRERQIKLLIGELSKSEIELVSAPFISDIFEEGDIQTFSDSGIHLLDLNVFYMIALYVSAMELLKILRKQLPYMDIGIWRGDTQIGETWIDILSPYFNSMTIGGYDRHRLEELSHRILRETGLSCEVTTDVANCIVGKDLIILTEKVEVNMGEDAISLLSYPIPIKGLKDMDGRFMFCSGIVELCCSPVTDMELNIWEYLALNHTLFYILNGSYGKFIDMAGRDDKNFKDFLNEHYVHPFCVKELVCGFETITYDRFRMLYFKNIDRREKVG